MEVITGIYKITNLKNNKIYIGQSRNIYNRWKQHTMLLNNSNLPTSRLRMAFIKYKLPVTVYKEGVYGNFKFEIIETCEEDRLIEKESKWIKKLQPEYNCSITTDWYAYSGSHFDRESKIWIQYHNCDKLNNYPAEDIFDRINDPELSEATHTTNTRKRALLYAIGDPLYLIIGKKLKGKTYYYLWTKTIIEEAEIDEKTEDERIIWAYGEQKFVYPPQLLNNQEGFQEFLKKIGNFAFGLTNIKDYPFAETLEKIYNRNKCFKEDMKFQEYINQFEEIHFGA